MSVYYLFASPVTIALPRLCRTLFFYPISISVPSFIHLCLVLFPYVLCPHTDSASISPPPFLSDSRAVSDRPQYYSFLHHHLFLIFLVLSLFGASFSLICPSSLPHSLLVSFMCDLFRRPRLYSLVFWPKHSIHSFSPELSAFGVLAIGTTPIKEHSVFRFGYHNRQRNVITAWCHDEHCISISVPSVSYIQLVTVW